MWVNVYRNPFIPTQFNGSMHRSRAKAKRAAKVELAWEPNTTLIARVRI